MVPYDEVASEYVESLQVLACHMSIMDIFVYDIGRSFSILIDTSILQLVINNSRELHRNREEGHTLVFDGWGHICQRVLQSLF